MRRQLSQKRRMISILILTCVLYSGSFLFANRGPKIVFKEDKWDFGRIKQGEVLTHIFVFKNTGDKTLEIERVKTDCGCTAALVSERSVAPGKEGEIEVTLRTRGYEGKLTKNIYVNSNDTDQPRRRLAVSVEIEVPPRPKIQLDRHSFDFGLALEKEKIQIQVKIKNKGERELKVKYSQKHATFFSGGKKVIFPLRIPSGKEAEVEIQIPPRTKRGLIREFVMLETNDPMRPRLSLHINGYIVSKKQLKELFVKYKDILD